ncbi:MAG TPA: PHP domain-containing protein [Vicinamibacterales bacterium]|jgi:DNA polymerase (family 10)|nr:PHP domain-containing protein [Vicinamibacterales bacterium]
MRPLTLGRAWDVLDSLLKAIAESCPAVDVAVAAGDSRRFEPLVSEITLVGRAVSLPAAIDQISALPGITVLRRSSRNVVVKHRDTDVDVQVAHPDDFGSVLFLATGSQAHLRAVLEGHRLSDARSEDEIYARAGLTFIAPELRSGTGEIEAAASGLLPALVSRENIRGDLHMHTTYSDGGDSLTDMVMACSALGYEYIAITDHSEGAAAANTLTEDQIARQREEIERLRERVPGMTILHGTEVDILADGSLDFSDAILQRFDVVLASLHESAGHDGRRLTQRCIAALKHPLVNVLTHPMNRLVGRRGGYELDYEAVYAAAVETGTALEVDGAPAHLDLDGEHARAAVAAGVTLTIDSDCHRAQALDRQMRLGIGTARRGWVEPAQVLNTGSIDAVRSFIRTKRVGAVS